MALSEDQIVRYGRQILLKDVGGRGQERLLSSPVRVRGGGPAIDDAVAWLLAGGTPIAPGTNPGGFLAQISVVAPAAAEPVAELVAQGLTSTAKRQVIVGAGVAFRSPEACLECWELTHPLLGAEPPPLGAGSLAALAVQRLVLGWSEALGIVRWRGDHFETGVVPPCLHQDKTQQ